MERLSPFEQDLLARTIIGEASNQPPIGQAAVAHVVLNRLRSGGYGGDLQDVLFAPKQFEPWNTRRDELMAYAPDDPAYKRAAAIADMVTNGRIADPTNGATHFANVATVQQRGNKSGMSWINQMVDNGSAVRIGAHTFGSPDSQPGRGNPAPPIVPVEKRELGEVFDPKEFESFEAKAVPDDFDPNEYASFKRAPAPIVATNEAETQAAEKATGMVPRSQWENFKAGLAAIAENPSLLAGIGPARIAGDIAHTAKEGATLPGDVAAGRVDPRSDQAIERAAGLATIASPLTPARAAATAVAPAVVEAVAPKIEPRAEVAAAAQRAGINIPRVALANPVVQKVGAGLSDLPVVGAPLQRSAERAVTQAGERVGELAGTVGNVSREAAGQGIKEGVQAFKADAIPALEKEVYAPINEAIAKDARFIPAETIQAISQIRGRLGESAGSLTGESARIQKALEQNKGNLTYQSIQDLRSALGAEMRDALNRQGYDDFVPARLYGALSNDMREAARTAGGDALAATWDAANARTAEAWQQFKAVKPLGADLLAPNAAFERVFNLAFDRRGNAGQIAKIEQTVGPERWKDVVATTIDRMGRNNAEGFSMPFFINNWEKMSDGAKGVLFRDQGLKQSISDLVASFKALQGIERFKSKSQSANPTALLGGGAIAGSLAGLFNTALAGAAAYAGASYLARPASAKAVSAWARAYTAAIKNPSAALAGKVYDRAGALGATIASESGVPHVAAQIASGFQGAVRALNDNVIRAPRSASASGRVDEQDEKNQRR